MTLANGFSESLADAVAAAQASVVRVEARRRLPASGIVWSEMGYIVTANHVLRRDNGIRVGLADGTAVEADLVGRDPSTDIALLRVEASTLAAPALAGLDKVRVGTIVLALGRPGASIQATHGIISAKGLSFMGGKGDSLLQTDVLMYPGFSGGPLVDAAGSIIGLNSSALMHGASVTLPHEMVSRAVVALQEHGRVRRGYLGVSTQVVRLQEENRESLGQKTGLLIVAIEPDSPADQGGLKIGDTIVKLGAETVRRHEDLLGALMQANLDEKTPVTIVRAGEVQTLNMQIGEQQ
ncbi:MAG: S1C family serine protease [Candidatus Promineifilaceae bacterium]